MGSSSLLRPTYLRAMPFGHEFLQDHLETRVQQYEKCYPERLSSEGVSLVIRTLNESSALIDLLDTVDSQKFAGEVEIIVVDNESNDSTPDVAKDFGAQVINIPRGEFTYPKSINTGVDSASFNNVFLTVGHSTIATCWALEAGLRWLQDDANGGVYAPVVTGQNASFTEGFIYGLWARELENREKFVTKATVGVMGGTNAFFRKDQWKEYGGFDERLENGGEDTDMARRMIQDGLRIVLEPLVTVHHSHGLGPINFSKQMLAWMKMANGDISKINQNEIRSRRPDLDFL